MHRTLLELQGISCIEIEQSPKARKQIIASRSFGQKVYSCEDLKEAITLLMRICIFALIVIASPLYISFHIPLN